MSRRPKGHTAVMADHAPLEVAADDPRTALFRKLEYFPTPPWAARAGGELIQRIDPGRWVAWEPACGGGHMAHGLADYFEAVHASDIHDHGWALQQAVVDFLSPVCGAVGEADWIVTNPPFGQAEAFVRLGLQRARRGVAILARSVLREGAGRHRLYVDHPLTVAAQFAERVPMSLGRWDPAGTTATAYSWFVWTQPRVASAAAELAAQARGVLGPTAAIDLVIAPGAKAALTRPSDRAFAVKGDAPLFEGVGS